MSRYFYLTIHDKSINKLYTFDGYNDINGDYTDIFIGDTNNFQNTNTCVHILLRKEYNHAELLDLIHRPKCEIERKLDEGKSGTDMMLKGSLKYVIDTFTHIQIVNLNDVATKGNPKVYLTPKRLLLGNQGWYQ